jgi:hypothetical protein
MDLCLEKRQIFGFLGKNTKFSRIFVDFMAFFGYNNMIEVLLSREFRNIIKRNLW